MIYDFFLPLVAMEDNNNLELEHNELNSNIRDKYKLETLENIKFYFTINSFRVSVKLSVLIL